MQPSPPPPSPALERALADLRPIRTRRPARVLIGVAATSVAYAATFIWRLGVRADFALIPAFPFALYAAGCLASFFALLWCALIPPRGQVLPSGSASVRATTLMLGALVGLDLALALHPLAPPAARVAASLVHVLAGGWRCLLTAACVVAVPLVLGLVALRRLLPLGGWRVMMALGGAAGALAGLVLHAHCSVADPAHVGVIHGAALVLPAVALAAATFGRLSSRPNRDKSDPETRHGS